MKSFEQHRTENRRLATLRLIAQYGGSTNESVLHTALTSMLGFPQTSREELRRDLEWMRERNLVQIERLPVEGERVLLVATITTDGLDGAAGRGTPIDGMARPAIAG